MNKVSGSIGWADYSWNPVTGCLYWKSGICAVKSCYAKKLAEGRLRGRCGYDSQDPFQPTFHENRILEPNHVPEYSRIFVSDMGDLFGEWVSDEWIEQILAVAKICSQYTFLFLTKNPSRYWNFDFPPNCWLGTTINRQEDIRIWKRDIYLEKAKAKVKFISFEPLYEELNIDLKPFQWIIIGGQSKPDKLIDYDGMCKIVAQAGDLRIPVFMKDNIPRNTPFQFRKEFPV